MNIFNKAVNFVFTVYTLSVFTTLFSTSFFLQIFCYILFWPIFIYSKYFKEKTLSMCAIYPNVFGFKYLLPFWDIKVTQKPNKIDFKKTIIICNHASMTDPWIIGTTIFPSVTKFVVKDSLRKIPIAGWVCHISNEPTIKFTKEKGGWGTVKGSVAKTYADVKRLIDLGLPVLVFPEGTRSKTGGLQPFKDGFFRFAVEHQLKILPCAMHNTNKLWPLNSKIINPGTAYVAIGEPISATEKTTEELKDICWNEIYKMQQTSPEFDPEKDKPVTAPTTRGHIY